VQILSSKSKSSTGGHLVIMFGLGMIGSAIRDSLLDFEYHLMARIDFDWQDVQQRDSDFSLIETSCLACSPPPDRISVVWSAGKGAFRSTQDELSRENIPFMDTVDFVLKLKKALDSARFDFHYISSAGGLFEGQRVINDKSIPAPVRPYGRLKLAQEQVLRNSFGKNEIAFYRPSSVYGPMVQKTQQGLINNLVSNGRNRRVTVLDAHVMALRDYVFSGDIGNFVAKRIRSGNTEVDGSPVHFLVSSRCSSIFEVVQKIERTLKLNLQFRYDESFGNNSNITFSDSVLPPGWSPSTLDVGIRQFLVGKNAH
jgi:nucleoside-diphosphate-sugar epimerase